jgi:hypothetical protein
VLLCITASAQSSDAYLFVVHGAAGRNIAPTTNPAIPVDVLANDQLCLVKGVAFGDVAGPITVPAGSYNLKVSLSDAINPCSKSAVFETTANLSAGTTTFGVIGISSAHQLIGQFFQPSLAPLSVGLSRVVIANMSDATLTAALTASSNEEINSLNNIAPLTSQTAEAPSANYTGAIYLAGTQNQVFGPLSADLASRSLNFYVLAGLTANNSVEVIGKEIKGIF